MTIDKTIFRRDLNGFSSYEEPRRGTTCPLYTWVEYQSQTVFLSGTFRVRSSQYGK